jgi:outer membrane protein TolC
MMGIGDWFRSIILRSKTRSVRRLEAKQIMTAYSVASIARSTVVGGSLLATVFMSGCSFSDENEDWSNDVSSAAPIVSSLDLDAPTLTAANPDLLSTPAPLSVLNEDEIEFAPITLQSAVQTALMNSQILRDLGGSILRSPGSVASTFDVALQEMNPRFGVAGALSAFDASFASEVFVEKNDRAINNQFFGGGTRQLKQDLANSSTSISKIGATGTEYTLRNETGYDSNNAPGNRFPTVFETWIDAEIRHPLLQGSGTEFNRIAGPNGTPGALNGVVLARLNTDISQADFEMSVRDFVSNVENAYWDLYYAYRELDSRIVARDASLETWNSVHALYEAGRAGGEAEKEAQAREQYFRFQQQVQDSLSGRLVDGTQTNNGSAGGSFRGTGGVMTAERRLRLLLGTAINDGRLLRPQDEPIEAQVTFDWEASLLEALSRRSELRRQKWLVTRREQELQASCSFLMPNLDVVGRYRWRGLGKHLLPHHSRNGALASAAENLTLGNQQEWQLGFEFEMPFGRRQAFAAVEHAELQLSRDRAVLAEQERVVVHQLSDAVAEMNRAYVTLETTGDRRLAATQQLEAIQAAYSARKVEFDLLLDAQRRHMEAETAWYKTLCEYTLAIRNVHYSKGSMLDYNEIYLTEDTWPVDAYSDAQRRNENKIPAEWLHNFIQRPAAVTQGPYAQNLENQPMYDESVPPAIPAPEAAQASEDPASEESARVPETEAAPAVSTPPLPADSAASGDSSAAIAPDGTPWLNPNPDSQSPVSQSKILPASAEFGSTEPEGQFEATPVEFATPSSSGPGRSPAFDDEFPLPDDTGN